MSIIHFSRILVEGRSRNSRKDAASGQSHFFHRDREDNNINKIILSRAHRSSPIPSLCPAWCPPGDEREDNSYFAAEFVSSARPSPRTLDTTSPCPPSSPPHRSCTSPEFPIMVKDDTLWRKSSKPTQGVSF